MNNNVWVPELASDTAFASWLAASGLTLAEAARIQVPYQSVSKTDMAGIAALAVGTPLAFTGSLVTSLWNGFGNAQGRRTTLNAVGMVSGLLSAGLGAVLIAQSNSSALPTVGLIGAASATAGTVSIALSSRAIHRHRAFLAAEHEAARRREVSVVPLVPVTGGSRA